MGIIIGWGTRKAGAGLIKSNIPNTRFASSVAICLVAFSLSLDAAYAEESIGAFALEVAP